MNRLSRTERAQIIRALVEGNSIRSTSRMTGFAQNTIMKLLRDLGAACADYQNRTLTNLPTKHVEADEIWAFVAAKRRTFPRSIAVSSDGATCGRGSPSTRTRD